MKNFFLTWKYIFPIVITMVINHSYAQERIKELNYVNVNSKVPRMIKFENNALITTQKALLSDSSSLDAPLKKYFNLNNNDKFIQLGKTNNSESGLHKTYQQYYKNYKVAYGVAKIHYNKNGLQYLSGHYLPSKEDVNLNVKLSENTAIDLAKTFFIQNTLGEIGNDKIKSTFEISTPVLQLIATNLESGDLKLCYKIDVKIIGNGKEVFVDANDGTIVFSNNLIHNCSNRILKNNLESTVNPTLPTSISAGSIFETRFSGTKLSITGYQGGVFNLRDDTRGNGIETFNAYNLASYTADGNGNFNINDGGMGNNTMSKINYVDNDNYWNYKKTAIEKTNAALDVHYYTQNFYDYFKKTYNRNSIDNLGKKLESYVNLWGNLINDPKLPSELYDYFVTNQAAVNAYWDGSKMVYYFGNNLTFDPVCSQDIVAHELGHGFCQNTASLVYLNESGALNEALSDIWGATIERNYFGTTKKTWNIGEEIDLKNKLGFRNMSNPGIFEQPNTYRGRYFQRSILFDNGGVHINSGIINYWYFLLVEGGIGKNDVGYRYNVNKIGMEIASKIVYETENNYLTPLANFTDFRYAVLEVTKNLYGENSKIYNSVQEAFLAVNLLSVEANDIPCSSTNKKRNDPAEYAWILSICNPNAVVQINSNLQSGNYIATRLILPWESPCNNNSYSFTNIANGGNVIFESGSKIVLKSFKIALGSKFNARQCLNYNLTQ